MSRENLKNLIALGLESEEENTPAVIEGGVDSMETAISDVEEAYDVVETVENDIEELEEIEEGLEGLVCTLEGMIETDGGLSTQSATMLHQAVHAYTRRLGLDASEIVASVESFGGDTGKATATTVSVESIGDTLKRIWAAIKAAVEKALRAIGDFYSKVFGGVDKVAARVKVLEGQIADLEKSKAVAGKDKMSVPNANTLHVGGDVKASTINKGLSNLVDVADEASGVADGAAGYYKAVSDKFTKLKSSDEESDVDAALKELLEYQGKTLTKLTSIDGKIMSGDKQMSGTVSGDDADATLSLKARQGAKNVQSPEVDVPSLSELKETLKHVSKLADIIKGNKASIEKLKSARNEAVAAAKKVVDDSDRGRAGKLWTKGKAHVLLRKAQSDIARPTHQVIAWSFSVSRAALGYVETALKKYEAPAAK